MGKSISTRTVSARSNEDGEKLSVGCGSRFTGNHELNISIRSIGKQTSNRTELMTVMLGLKRDEN